MVGKETVQDIETTINLTRTQTSTYILFCDKTWVQMFYFDSKTAKPIVPL